MNLIRRLSRIQRNGSCGGKHFNRLNLIRRDPFNRQKIIAGHSQGRNAQLPDCPITQVSSQSCRSTGSNSTMRCVATPACK